MEGEGEGVGAVRGVCNQSNMGYLDVEEGVAVEEEVAVEEALMEAGTGQ